MKRTVFVFLTLMLVAALSACNGSPATFEPKETAQTQNNAGTESSAAASETQETGRTQSNAGPEDNTQDDELWLDAVRYFQLEEKVYYFEFQEYEEADGVLTPRQGADLVLSDVVKPSGLIEGIPADMSVLIAFDSTKVLDSANGRECYLYTVSIGEWEHEDVETMMIASVDYQSRTAAMYDDMRGPGPGDTYVPERDDDDGSGDVVSDDLPIWTGVYIGGEGFALDITSYDGSRFIFGITMTTTTQLTVVLEGEAVHEYPDYNKYEAAYDGSAPGDDELAFGINEDGSIDIRAAEGSEWVHLRGRYERYD